MITKIISEKQGIFIELQRERKPRAPPIIIWSPKLLLIDNEDAVNERRTITIAKAHNPRLRKNMKEYIICVEFISLFIISLSIGRNVLAI